MATTRAPVSDFVASDSTIHQIIRDRVDAQRSAGIVVGVIDPDDERRVAFYGDPGPGQPALDATSVFETGSLTKVFTATLLADMVQRGEARLDEPVARLLPETVSVPAQGDRQIELLDLATQTSGLPRLPTNVRSADAANPMADYTVEQLYEFLSSYALTRDIGSDYEYSTRASGYWGTPLPCIPGEATRTACIGSGT
jgi:D-alanyl-D-alanine-carboxypeptidase/D-alanyl-D-alanine-endopeptidase